MITRLLIIEDSPTQAQELKLHYESKGFRVETTSDGIAGLAVLEIARFQEAHYPDVIVLDNLLPGESGIEVCRQLKSSAEYRAIPVLIYSVEKELSGVVAAYDAGADYYVTKDAFGQKLLDLLIEAVLIRLRRRAGKVTKPFVAR